jgi:nitrate reductase assembly molybdenum cofactor insertion protein NarJ
MGFATIDRTADAKERIAKAKRIVGRTIWGWLKTLLSFSEALTQHKLEEAEELLEAFKEEETIQEVMGACLNIVEETSKRK